MFEYAISGNVAPERAQNNFLPRDTPQPDKTVIPSRIEGEEPPKIRNYLRSSYAHALVKLRRAKANVPKKFLLS